MLSPVRAHAMQVACIFAGHWLTLCVAAVAVGDCLADMELLGRESDKMTLHHSMKSMHMSTQLTPHLQSSR